MSGLTLTKAPVGWTPDEVEIYTFLGCAQGWRDYSAERVQKELTDSEKKALHSMKNKFGVEYVTFKGVELV